MVVELLEKAIGAPVTVPEHPQEIGALGVAIAAREAALGPRRVEGVA
jgi:activator of 2-hydroxyglutaryl-CoA dehydratase